MAGSKEVEEQAIIQKKTAILDGFTKNCVDEALATVNRLRKSIDS